MLVQRWKLCPSVTIIDVSQYALDPVVINLDCSAAYYMATDR
jgi:hypothetical protein